MKITKNDLREIIKKEILFESGVVRIANVVSKDLVKFLKDIIIPKSKGYVKDERDAALLLYDILKHKYNI